MKRKRLTSPDDPHVMGRKPAFTLVELIAVVAIISLLTTLVATAVSRGKHQALSLQCKNNLRQIGLAMAIYVNESRFYPTAYEFGACYCWPLSNRTSLYFADSRMVVECPARHPTGPVSGTGYGINGLGTADRIGYSLGLGYAHERVRESEVRIPCEMVAVGDSGTDETSDFLLGPRAGMRCCEEPLSRFCKGWLVSNRHGGGANISFCDGHVEYAKHAVWVAATEAMRARWNRDHEPHPETWALDGDGP